MKKNILFLLLICFASLLQAQDTTRVLFIGNSITYFNNMPQTFEAIANSKGDTTAITMYAPGGTGFVNHATDPNVFAHFRQGNWDYIVLQPGSNESPGYSYPIDQTLQRARVLQDSIYKYNPCVEVLFYEISYGVWGNSASDLVTYNNTMGLIRTNLTHLADSTQTFFAPVGEAFQAAWNQNQNNLLWGGFGDIHPNVKGSYIAACVFYTTIFQKPSRGTTVLNSLSALEADAYQQLADTTVLHNLASWRIGTFQQSTDFSSSINANTVNFTNLSSNIDSSFWEFGNMNTSIASNPIQYYNTIGSYDVTLVTYKNGCAQSISKTINIGALGLGKVKQTTLYSSIYPNPTKDYLNIKLQNTKATYNFEIYNNLGQLLLRTNKTQIDVAHFPQGMYYINVTNSKTLESHLHKWEKYL
jgi:PKD repeat protein